MKKAMESKLSKYVSPLKQQQRPATARTKPAAKPMTIEIVEEETVEEDITGLPNNHKFINAELEAKTQQIKAEFE